MRGNISYDGRQYSYPANCGVDILIYNKAIIDEMGAPYPQQDISWEDVFELARRVTRRNSSTRLRLAQESFHEFSRRAGWSTMSHSS